MLSHDETTRLFSALPITLELRDSVGSSRDGELLHFGLEGHHCYPSGAELIVHPIENAVSFSFLLGAHGPQGKLVRTPIGKLWRRVAHKLHIRPWSDTFASTFAIDFPRDRRDTGWIPDTLAQRLVLGQGFELLTADLINVQAKPQCILTVVCRLAPPEPNATACAYDLACRICAQWVPSVPLRA